MFCFLVLKFAYVLLDLTDQILQKELDALTYRVLAYLLLGLVRIYSKKVDFLFHDCNTAFIAVKEFVAKDKNNRDNTNVPLPAAAASTVFSSIALPQCFELDAFDLGVLEDSHGYFACSSCAVMYQLLYSLTFLFLLFFSGTMLGLRKILHLNKVITTANTFEFCHVFIPLHCDETVGGAAGRDTESMDHYYMERVWLLT